MDPITGGLLVFLVVFVASLVLMAGFGVAVCAAFGRNKGSASGSRARSRTTTEGKVIQGVQTSAGCA